MANSERSSVRSVRCREECPISNGMTAVAVGWCQSCMWMRRYETVWTYAGQILNCLCFEGFIFEFDMVLECQLDECAVDV